MSSPSGARKFFWLRGPRLFQHCSEAIIFFFGHLCARYLFFNFGDVLEGSLLRVTQPRCTHSRLHHMHKFDSISVFPVGRRPLGTT